MSSKEKSFYNEMHLKAWSIENLFTNQNLSTSEGIGLANLRAQLITIDLLRELIDMRGKDATDS